MVGSGGVNVWFKGGECYSNATLSLHLSKAKATIICFHIILYHDLGVDLVLIKANRSGAHPNINLFHYRENGNALRPVNKSPVLSKPAVFH
ncbi:hypothetical protein AEQU3_01750 [Aequorivita antarctica]|nr:hypothetical protein AEQU3_01750 [Aequorivita antarctica]